MDFESLARELALLRTERSRFEADVQAKLAGIAADLAAMRLRVEGKKRRNELLCQLAGALGLGRTTFASAAAVSLILAGVRSTPPGAEATVAALAETRLSDRQILRILQDGAAAEAADKSSAFCHSWPPREDVGTSTQDRDDAC